MEDIKLTQIVEGVQKDIRQFEILYSKIVQKVYYWCFTIMKNQADAEDCTQEAMICIYKQIHTLRNVEYFNSWMYRVVTNVCYKSLEKRKRKESELFRCSDFLEDAEAMIPDHRDESMPDKVYGIDETKQIISSFVSGLPKRQREVITLYYLEEFKVDEVAEILGCSSGSVRSRLHEGRKKLEKQVGAYQKKHQIKLYDFAWVPIIGSILSEQSNELLKTKQFKFDQSMYRAPWIAQTTSVISNNIGMFLGSLLSISVVTLAILLNQSKEFSIVNDTVQEEQIAKEMNEKIKKFEYFESLTYSNFPTRDAVEVQIKVKKDIRKDDIQILYKKKNVSFDKNNKEITLDIKENGIYDIYIKNEHQTININHINKKAPQLIGVQNYKTYLQLLVEDELFQIDYKSSYIEQGQSRFDILNLERVEGEFKGVIKIILFNKNNTHIIYEVNVD